MPESPSPMPNSQPYIELPSRGVVRVGGPERQTFLNNLVTNSVAESLDGAVYSALLTPQGKILFDFFVVQHGDDYLLDCHGAFAADLVKRLTMYRLRAKVEIEDVSAQWQVFAADQGAPAVEDAIIFADPRASSMPTRLLAPRDTIKAEDCRKEEDYLARQLAAGLPHVPLDAGQNEMFLLEANFEELHGVDFKKGCYIGQELAARMKHRATVRKRLMPVTLNGPLPAPGTSVLAGEREVGTLKHGIGKRAIALVRIDRVEGAEHLTADDVSLTINWPEWFPR